MYCIYLESDVRKGEEEHEGVTSEAREKEMEYREWGQHQVPGGGGKDHITLSGG